MRSLKQGDYCCQLRHYDDLKGSSCRNFNRASLGLISFLTAAHPDVGVQGDAV